MKILNGLLNLFLLPGNLVLRRLDLDIKDDGGIIRSFVNMIVWGIVVFSVIMLVMF